MKKDYKELYGKTIYYFKVEEVIRINNKPVAKGTCLLCGNPHQIRVDSLISGDIKSCGCKRIENVRKAITKYKYNKELFLSNTNEMYYILGIIFSDGNLRTNRVSLRITLKADDKYLLEHIGYLIKGSRKLGYNKINNSYEFCGDDCTIYNQLLTHGLTPKKSKILTVPNHLKDNSHFWRGIFDGDGWITISKTGAIAIGICGTLDICNKFKIYCNSIVNISSNVYIRDTNYGQLIISGIKSTKILNELYKDKSIYFLKRKYEKYEKYMKSKTQTLEI